MVFVFMQGTRGNRGQAGNPGSLGDNGRRGRDGMKGQKGRKGAQVKLPFILSRTIVSFVSGFPSIFLSRNQDIG